MLTIRESLPGGLLERNAAELHEQLSGPTLFHLKGRRQPPLFVCVLLHGNEDTGWEAMRTLLRDHAERPLPRDLLLFVGNVEAARYGLRRLEDGPDFNRIWNGNEGDHPLVRELMAALPDQLFASIDIHNNTGRNPHYACINQLDYRFLYLATLFSRTIVFFRRPDSVQSLRFSARCPAVTVECGKPGETLAHAHAREYVEAVMHLREIPAHVIPPRDYDLFHTVATVKVPGGIKFSFGERQADIYFKPDLDALNFHELPADSVLAGVNGDGIRLEVRDESDRDVSQHYFRVVDGELRTRRPVMPSMLTVNERVIRQDCLCYLMERLPPLQ